ncbi:hypothetical protein BZA70DRAFT_270280 [Myxozyma melibiosi]|uniref:Uncharacterized protein n=1 Tax=Myxozyma melibiosi TaxID=54550 RepID=A0ABR1FB18_9ASCO
MTGAVYTQHQIESWYSAFNSALCLPAPSKTAIFPEKAEYDVTEFDEIVRNAVAGTGNEILMTVCAVMDSTRAIGCVYISEPARPAGSDAAEEHWSALAKMVVGAARDHNFSETRSISLLEEKLAGAHDLQKLGFLLPRLQSDINNFLTGRVESSHSVASEQEKLLEKKVLDGDEEVEDEEEI